MVRPFQNDSYDRLMVLDQIETLEYKFTELVIGVITFFFE